MTAEQTFVIVGASLAGAKAAQTLRHEGFEGRLVLVGSEDERPYERPPLSKDYLRGSREFIAFWLSGDRVLAGMNVGVWDVVDPIQRLIRERVPVEDWSLSDPGVALEQLVPIESA